MTTSWLNPREVTDPLGIKSGSQDRDTMYMKTISEEDREKKERLIAGVQHDGLRTNDVVGAAPRNCTRERKNWGALNDEIPGTKPKTRHRELNRGPEPPVDATASELAHQRKKEAARLALAEAGFAAGARKPERPQGRYHSHQDGLYQLSGVIPRPNESPAEPQKLFRETMIISDIPGSRPKPPVDLSRPAKQSLDDSDVEGSSAHWRKMQRERIITNAGHEQRVPKPDTLSVKDINEDGVFVSHRVTNPLEPVYKFDDGEEGYVGEVIGSHPREAPKKKDYTPTSLRVADIMDDLPRNKIKPRTRDPRVDDPVFKDAGGALDPNLLTAEQIAVYTKHMRDQPAFGMTKKQVTESVGDSLKHPEFDEDFFAPISDDEEEEPAAPPPPKEESKYYRSGGRGPTYVPRPPSPMRTEQMMPAGRPSTRTAFDPTGAVTQRSVQSMSGRPITTAMVARLRDGGGVADALGFGPSPRSNQTRTGSRASMRSTTSSGRQLTQDNVRIAAGALGAAFSKLSTPSEVKLNQQRAAAARNEDIESVRSLR